MKNMRSKEHAGQKPLLINLSPNTSLRASIDGLAVWAVVESYWKNLYWCSSISSFRNARIICSMYILFLFGRLFNNAFSIKTIALNGRMTAEWWHTGQDLEGSGQGPIKVLSWHLTGGNEENHKKTSARIASVSAKTQTEHPQIQV
jgi:hypothetical protein